MDYHEGSRLDRVEAVDNIPDDWSFDTFLDLLGGLWDHGWQVQDAARIRLLQLACLPGIEPITIHPLDLAKRWVTPSTYKESHELVRQMREIGLPAKEICENFFNKLASDAKQKQRECLEILKGSELYEIARQALGQGDT